MGDHPMVTSMIDIQHTHSMDDAQIRQIVQSLADKLSERYEVANQWEGDRLLLSRSGVQGAINLGPGNVRVTVELGFPLSMMQPMVEGEIRRLLGERLA